MKIFKYIFDKIRHFFMYIAYCFLYLIAKILMPCKVKGRKNWNKKDEARVYVANHLQLYGPVTFFLRFHGKKAIWINEKMLDEKKIAKEMSLSVMDEHNYKWAPKWFKKIAIFILKGLCYYILKYRVKNISVSRDNKCSLIPTLEETRKYINKKYSIVIFPEVNYDTTLGIGEVFNGFATVGKYMFKKDGKITSFYPVYIDKTHKSATILKPIKFDPKDTDYANTIANYVTSSINGLAKPEEKQEQSNNLQNAELS